MKEELKTTFTRSMETDEGTKAINNAGIDRFANEILAFANALTKNKEERVNLILNIAVNVVGNLTKAIAESFNDEPKTFVKFSALTQALISHWFERSQKRFEEEYSKRKEGE